MTMAGSEPNADNLVEVLKEIRDELRAVRTELGGRTGRMSSSGIRTAVVDRAARWRNAALAIGGLALLAIVFGVATRERSAPAIVAVAPQLSATPVVRPAMATAMPPATQAPVAVAPPAAVPATKSPQPLAVKPTTKPALRAPATAPGLASVPAPTKKRLKPDVAAKPPSEVESDEDEAIAFSSPPPRRVRAHRMSYGPVDSEPAKL
jgi:hypothetical protein